MHTHYRSRRLLFKDRVAKYSDYPSSMTGSGNLLDDDGSLVGNDMDPYLQCGGAFNMADGKNTQDFKYLKFDTLPKFSAAHKSLMARHLTEERFAALKDVATKSGYSLANAIQTGVVTPHLGV
jgi:hypothetical protein